MPLLRPEDLALPATSIVVVMVPDEGLTLYRLLRGAEPWQKDFEPGFTRPPGAATRLFDAGLAERGEFCVVGQNDAGEVIRVFDVDDEVAPSASAAAG